MENKEQASSYPSNVKGAREARYIPTHRTQDGQAEMSSAAVAFISGRFAHAC